MTIPSRVAEDRAFRNARQNSAGENPRIEQDRALPRVMTSVMEDDAALFREFMDNEGTSAGRRIRCSRFRSNGRRRADAVPVRPCTYRTTFASSEEKRRANLFAVWSHSQSERPSLQESSVHEDSDGPLVLMS